MKKISTPKRGPLTFDDIACKLGDPSAGPSPAASTSGATADLPENRNLPHLPGARLPKKLTLYVDESGVFKISSNHSQLRYLIIESSLARKMQARFVDFSALGRLAHLRELWIHHGLVPTNFDFLVPLKKLSSLWLQPPMTVNDLTFLDIQPQLKKVQLDFNRITSLETTVPMNALVKLSVSSLSLREAIVTEKMPNLQGLTLSGENIDLRMTTVFKDLKSVSISARSLRNLDFLAHCPNLEFLLLSIYSPTRRIEHLLTLKKLKTVYGKTRALSKADRERVEKDKPGVLHLYPD